MANSDAPKCPYSPSQMEVLSALCDTFLPSIDVSRRDQLHESVVEFFQTSASMAGTPLPVRILYFPFALFFVGIRYFLRKFHVRLLSLVRNLEAEHENF